MAEASERLVIISVVLSEDRRTDKHEAMTWRGTIEQRRDELGTATLAPTSGAACSRVEVMTASSGSGRCLCGEVRYVVDGELRDVWLCHCLDCQHVTGSHMAATQAAVDDVTIAADAALRWYSNQPGVEYGFCGTCGSTLFWRASDKADRLSICAGTLDQPTGLTTSGILFRAVAADYVTIHPDVPTESYDRP